MVVVGRTMFSPGLTAIAETGLPKESVTVTNLSGSRSISVSRLNSCFTLIVYLAESETFWYPSKFACKVTLLEPMLASSGTQRVILTI